MADWGKPSLADGKSMPLLVFAKEVQTFIRACEHLLSSPPISDDEKAFVAYYIQELSHKYGGPEADTPASAEVGQGDQP